MTESMELRGIPSIRSLRNHWFKTTFYFIKVVELDEDYYETTKLQYDETGSIATALFFHNLKICNAFLETS